MGIKHLTWVHKEQPKDDNAIISVMMTDHDKAITKGTVHVCSSFLVN